MRYHFATNASAQPAISDSSARPSRRGGAAALRGSPVARSVPTRRPVPIATGRDLIPTVARPRPSAVIRATSVPAAPLITAVTVTRPSGVTRNVCPGRPRRRRSGRTPSIPVRHRMIARGTNDRSATHRRSPASRVPPRVRRSGASRPAGVCRASRCRRLPLRVGPAAVTAAKCEATVHRRRSICHSTPRGHRRRRNRTPTLNPAAARRMSGDHQTARFADLGGKAREHPVAWPVSPVDPGSG